MDQGREAAVRVEWVAARYQGSASRLEEHVCILCGRRDGDALAVSRLETTVYWCVHCGRDLLRVAAVFGAITAESSKPTAESSKPTAAQLADLLEDLSTQGMPPRGQARHVVFHYPGMVREEESE